MRSGPSVTIVRTTAWSHRPAPASSVSRTCSSNESSSLVTQAIPPCAQAVFVSEPLRFVITATEPCIAAFNAKLRPAIPLPITTKSYSFMRTVKQQSCPLGLNAQTRRQIGLSRRIPSSQPDIVDQASFPEEHSNREQRIRPDRCNGLQGFRIDKLHVINSSLRRFTDHFSNKIDNFSR